MNPVEQVLVAVVIALALLGIVITTGALMGRRHE